MGKHRTSRDGEGRAVGVRHPRLEELFREELNSILDFETTDPRLEGTRISYVELSRDGSRARVWVSLNANANGNLIRAAGAVELEAAFERAAGFFRGRLCEALPLKRMPDLSFRLDPAASAELVNELEPNDGN
ncbi:MAG TPA: ribosome-binding factor A [Polyangiaceae bacterium]|nr:ribosome-binding factor A [Polyangiaceae bacterium]